MADGAANYANLRLYRDTGSNRIIPFLGLLGTIVAVPIVIHHLWVTDPTILRHIAAMFIGLLVVEFLYIERKPMEEEAEEIEEEVEKEVEKVEEEVEEKLE
ncbi:MAG: hypothetical protein ABEJ91_04330 [Candidatus Nanohaloarchaea archaeon]